MSDTNAVAIVGAGQMGHGIAIQCALSGHEVALVGHRQRNINRAQQRIREVVAFLNEQRIADESPDAVLEAIEFTLDTSEATESVDVVLETIAEDLAAKRELFAELADVTPSDAVLASNTSGLRISAIAEGAREHAERIAGCHWWFPPYLLRPVEIVRGAETSPRTIARLESFVESVDRDPVFVEHDVPGFVWNRVQFAVIRECLHIVEEGIATASDVNRAIRDGYAMRTAAIGPFETMDIAGLDLFATIAEDLYPALATDDQPQEPLTARVLDGQTGIDAGAGFFESEDDPEEVVRRRDEKIAAIRRALSEDSG